MKKLTALGLVLVLLLAVLSGCSGDSAEESVIRIGVTPEPHSRLVELVKDDLEAEGITLEIIEFTDYVKPNLALADGELDANFFQHQPYLDDFSEAEGLDLVSIGGVHVEPMALYANEAGSVEELEDGSEIAIPNDTVNGGRALILLQNNGLITLKEGAGLEATENDIAENPHNFVFTALEAAALPRVLDEVDAAVINGNFALQAGLNPINDGILIEGENSPYANIVVVRAGEENEEKYQKLSFDNLSYLDQLIFRFSKLQDSMGNRLFPAILENLGEDIEGKPFIDLLTKMEKLGLISSHKQWLKLRETRNSVTHEYPFFTPEIIEGLNLLIEQAEVLSSLWLNLKDYSSKRFSI